MGENTPGHDTNYQQGMEDPTEEVLHPERQSHKNMEMQTIQSLTLGMTRQKICSIAKEKK
jgi:hypothetical protein